LRETLRVKFSSAERMRSGVRWGASIPPPNFQETSDVFHAADLRCSARLISADETPFPVCRSPSE
jgi:hypothetical protein